MRRFTLLVAALLAARSLPAQTEAPSGRLTLEDAIRLAMENKPSFRALMNDRDVDAARIRFSKSQLYYPTLGVQFGSSGGSNRSATPVTTTSSSNSSTSVTASLSFTIWDGGQRLNNLRRDRNTADQTNVTIEEQTLALRISVTQAYFAAQQAQQTIELNKRQLARGKNDLEFANRRLRVATADALDVATSQLAVKQYEQGLLNATDAARKAKLNLLDAIGFAGEPAFEVDTVLPAAIDPETIDATRLVAQAMTTNQPLRSSEISLETQRRNAKLTHSLRWWPTIRTGATFGRSQNDRDYSSFVAPFPENSNLGFSISASYQLPEFFSNNFSILQTDAGLDDSELNLRQRRLSLERQVRTAVINLQTAFANLALQEQQLQLTQARVNLAQEKVRTGSMSSLDYQRVIDELATAEKSLLDARFAVLGNQIALEQIIGVPLRP